MIKLLIQVHNDCGSLRQILQHVVVEDLKNPVASGVVPAMLERSLTVAQHVRQCLPSLLSQSRQMGQRSELSFLQVYRLALWGRESTAAPMAKAK